MNFLTLLQAAPAAQPQGGGWSMWIMLALIFVVMWFFMIRPQRKQQKELQAFRDGLKKGERWLPSVASMAQYARSRRVLFSSRLTTM